jgi:hypothetical protein
MAATAGRTRGPDEVRTPVHRPSLSYHVRAWLRRAALDSQLAAGADPAASLELERRATRITTARCRAELAVGIERVLEAAEEPPLTFSSSAPLRRPEVLAARDALLSLACDLRSERPVCARGVALTRRLLTDARSPLYSATGADDIQHAARSARDAL